MRLSKKTSQLELIVAMKECKFIKIKVEPWGTCVVQSVKRLTLAQVMISRFMGSS